MRHSLSVMRRIGTQLVNEKKAEVVRLAAEGDNPNQLHGRDLLSVLVKNNMKEAEDQKMTDEEILARKCAVDPNPCEAHCAQ